MSVGELVQEWLYIRIEKRDVLIDVVLNEKRVYRDR